MPTVYRLRSVQNLLCDRQELANQEIYFADPKELNDPMEGIRHIVWQGDRIVWLNLFKHYIYCVHRMYLHVKFLEPDDELDANDIPIMDDYDRPPTPQFGALFNNIWKRTCGTLNLIALADQLTAANYEMGYNDLTHLLFYALHSGSIVIIHKIYVEQGLEQATDWDLQSHWPKASVMFDGNYFKKLYKLKVESPEFVEAHRRIVYEMMAKQRLRIRYAAYFKVTVQVPPVRSA